ncbi:pentapeptide repeat-containing protein [Streptosporangium sp. NPDC000563]|uniref:pentapeptide repeat-containing protein n=1 Tax=Streptosporangium sp. NPDC000563 TaxID=3154366 RepID=UPI0033188E2E
MRRFPQFVRRLRRQPVLETKSAKLLPIGWALTLTLALAVTATGLLLFGALAWLGLPAATGKRPTVAEFLDTLKIVLAVIGGIGGVVALVVAYRKQRISEEENHRARETARREDVKLYVDRFDKASGKLGDASAAVRLAAVHALASLADDWSGGRQMCIDVLCAYLRMPLEPDADQDPAGLATWRAMREVRATILRLIGAHLHRDAPISWAGADLDFTGVVFDQGADFKHAVFSGGQVSFADAVFSGDTVWFTDAAFSGGQVSFFGAKFSGEMIWFTGAEFSGGTVSFDDAEFSGRAISFGDAEFSGGEVSFTDAVFSSIGMVWFGRAKFAGGEVSFTNAAFSGGTVLFTDAAFSGGQVSFFGAKFSGGKASFSGVEFSGGEVWFRHTEFSGGEVVFSDAGFSGGEVVFSDAGFSGGKVVFSDAKFAGGEVDLTAVADWSCPPIGLPDTAEGLRLPGQPTAQPTDEAGGQSASGDLNRASGANATGAV